MGRRNKVDSLAVRKKVWLTARVKSPKKRRYSTDLPLIGLYIQRQNNS